MINGEKRIKKCDVKSSDHYGQKAISEIIVKQYAGGSSEPGKEEIASRTCKYLAECKDNLSIECELLVNIRKNIKA